MPSTLNAQTQRLVSQLFSDLLADIAVSPVEQFLPGTDFCGPVGSEKRNAACSSPHSDNRNQAHGSRSEQNPPQAQPVTAITDQGEKRAGSPQGMNHAALAFGAGGEQVAYALSQMRGKAARKRLTGGNDSRGNGDGSLPFSPFVLPSGLLVRPLGKSAMVAAHTFGPVGNPAAAQMPLVDAQQAMNSFLPQRPQPPIAGSGLGTVPPAMAGVSATGGGDQLPGNSAIKSTIQTKGPISATGDFGNPNAGQDVTKMAWALEAVARATGRLLPRCAVARRTDKSAASVSVARPTARDKAALGNSLFDSAMQSLGVSAKPGGLFGPKAVAGANKSLPGIQTQAGRPRAGMGGLDHALDQSVIDTQMDDAWAGRPAPRVALALPDQTLAGRGEFGAYVPTAQSLFADPAGARAANPAPAATPQGIFPQLNRGQQQPLHGQTMVKGGAARPTAKVDWGHRLRRLRERREIPGELAAVPYDDNGKPRPSQKQANGDMLATKAWQAAGYSPEEAARRAGSSLALPGTPKKPKQGKSGQPQVKSAALPLGRLATTFKGVGAGKLSRPLATARQGLRTAAGVPANQTMLGGNRVGPQPSLPVRASRVARSVGTLATSPNIPGLNAAPGRVRARPLGPMRQSAGNTMRMMPLMGAGVAAASGVLQAAPVIGETVKTTVGLGDQSPLARQMASDVRGAIIPVARQAIHDYTAQKKPQNWLSAIKSTAGATSAAGQAANLATAPAESMDALMSRMAVKYGPRWAMKAYQDPKALGGALPKAYGQYGLDHVKQLMAQQAN